MTKNLFTYFRLNKMNDDLASTLITNLTQLLFLNFLLF